MVHNPVARHLKLFRQEALSAGFTKAWQTDEYATIIEVAKKIGENVLREYNKLLMLNHLALTQTGGE